MKLADDILQQLSKKIDKSYSKNKIEDTLELIRAKARLEYDYNQFYKDDESEKILFELSQKYFSNYKQEKDDNTVLFYDGFGLDTRGLVQIYLKALIANNYRVIYVTSAKKNDDQPQVMSILKKSDAIVFHLDYKECTKGIEKLLDIFSSNKFSKAILYTTPWDVVGAIGFNGLGGFCMRYQINLTDQAFWLGVNAFDYCVEFRNYGAAISRDYRKIESSKLVKLSYYPIVNRDNKFEGFPFNTTDKKIIFSGGAIYKTIDKEKKFYQLVKNVLKKNEDVIFVYASDETCSDLDELIKKYPKQAYHIKERKDLFQVLQNSYLYLNTYPISGALMLQYASMAGCIPITLKRFWDDDASGILLDEERLAETFTDFDSVLNEINRLLTDSEYYKYKKKNLYSQVISEKDFIEKLNVLIKNPKELIISSIVAVNTDRFRKTYDENLSINAINNALIHKNEYKVYKYFPMLFVKKVIRKIM